LENQPRTAAEIDAIACAELPDSPELRELVLKHNVHKCAPRCQKDGVCTARFPKPFAEETHWPENAVSPNFRRRSAEMGGNREMRNGTMIDNSMIVSYNPYLTMKYNCHINVDICVSLRACKYVFSYCYKGPDRAMVQRQEGQPVNEIQEYQDMRAIGSCEAAWRLYGFDSYKCLPSVMSLPIHFEDMQTIYFRNNAAVRDAFRPENLKDTELMAWMAWNAANVHLPLEQKHTYVNFPRHFTFSKQDRVWNPRRNNLTFPTVGRIHTVHPSAGDLFYLRIFLNTDMSRGKTSWADLLTVDGVLQPSFKAVCGAHNLLRDDAEWHAALRDAELTRMGPQVRELFVTILLFSEPADNAALFDQHWDAMSDDFTRAADRQGRGPIPDDVRRTMVLLDIANRLESQGSNLLRVHLEEPTAALRQAAEQVRPALQRAQLPRIIQEEMDYDFFENERRAHNQEPLLRDEQRALVTAVLDAVRAEQPFAAFVDAPGGTGKTFVFNHLLAAVRGQGNVALAVAYSGIAATLLDGGRTLNSRFRVPLVTNEQSLCNIPAQSALADLIRRTKLIVWDEAPMVHKHLLETLDRSFRDVMRRPNVPFGGKVLLLGGDFRQILPVIKRGNRAQTVGACLKRSALWRHFRQFRLTENMRVVDRTGQEGIDYSDYRPRPWPSRRTR
jgi:hypothetical protein